MRVVISGGSGQVGSILSRHYHAAGHEVVVLSRRTFSAPWPVLRWDGLHRGTWEGTLHGADVLINLAGRSVNCRYNRRHRREILDSRVASTRVLGEVVSSMANPPGSLD